MIRPAAGCRLFVLEDGGVLFSDSAQELHALNARATCAWLALESGASRSAIVQAFDRLFCCGEAQARTEVEGLLSDWIARGWVTDGHRRPACARARSERRRGAAGPAARAAASPRRAARAPAYRLLSTRFAVAVQDGEARSLISAAIAHLACEPGATADVLVEVDRSGDEYSLRVDGELTGSVGSVDAITPLVKLELRRRAADRHDYFMQLHAGAVTAGSECLLFPGSIGSGKTTLVASLIASGFGYLSDEIVLLEPRTLTVRPAPLALTVKPGAVGPLEALHPGLAALSVHRREDGKRVRYLPPPRESIVPDVESGYPVTALVFPRFAADAPGELRALGGIEAFGRLMGCCQSLPEWLSAEQVEALVRWMRGLRCFELRACSVPEAVRNVRRVAEPSGRATACV